MIGIAIAAGVLLLLSLAYVRTPFLSKPWRVVLRSGPTSHAIRVLLVRRFHFADGLSSESWFMVGSVEPDDADFDERLVELQFKANEIRRRMEAIG